MLIRKGVAQKSVLCTSSDICEAHVTRRYRCTVFYSSLILSFRISFTRGEVTFGEGSILNFELLKYDFDGATEAMLLLF